MISTLRGRRALVFAGAISLGALTGCSPIVATAAASQANSVGCANVIVRLPDTVAGLSRRETNAQGTGAWGDPATVLLRCGVGVPAASSLPCVVIGSVSWLQDDSYAPSYRYTSYGRTPAVEVTMDHGTVSPGTALGDLAWSVDLTKPNDHQCLSNSDSPPG